MLHVLLIASFAVMVLRDHGLPPVLGEAGLPLVLALTLGPIALAALAVQAAAMVAMRGLDAHGGLHGVILTDRVQMLARFVAVAAHTAGVLVLGSLDMVRAWLGGDLILIDELVTVSPVLLMILAGWWSTYPLDRRLREAMLLRDLDEGRPLHHPPSRARSIVLHVRHQLLITLIPLTALTAWSEAIEHGADAILERVRDDAAAQPAWVQKVGSWLVDPQVGPLITDGAGLLGASAVLVLMPLVLRVAWDTTPLGPGPMRERLAGLCRAAGVRVRELLVWRTSGTMLNGAVLGVCRPWRYVLLTDALLEHLPERQVEAVMAHEVGHIRRRHMPWLLLSLLALMVVVGLVIDGALYLSRIRLSEDAWQAVSVGASLAALVVSLIGLGFISRRFEWQADAFAAQQLSGPGPTVTPEAAGAMQGALRQVARLNHIAVHKFGFRHGSIAARIARLQATVDQPVDRLPIDATVRTMKRVVLALVLIDVTAMILWSGR